MGGTDQTGGDDRAASSDQDATGAGAADDGDGSLATAVDALRDDAATAAGHDHDAHATVALQMTPRATSLEQRAAHRRRAGPADVSDGGTMSQTTAIDALRDEEIERTRLFIRMGWLIGALAAGTIWFVDAPFAMSAVLVAGLAIGIVYGVVVYRRFADPRNFTDRALLGLSAVWVINGHLAVMLFGAYSGAPMMIVVGIHFIGRTELTRVARWIFVTAVGCYGAISAAIISGVIADPGVFASERAVTATSLIGATAFVLGAYALAYYTAVTFRTASLSSIDELQRATRLASQREAVMEEVRADLERALRVGGPGRYTDQTVGRYRLGIVIGRGAMGEVYEASHVDTGAPAAVKLLRRELLADPTLVARFLREVRASGALASPHVARVIDAAGLDDAVPFLAMERLHGQTLGELLRRQARLSASATLELVRHAAMAVDAAAAAGIVHRDLKPQNLFRTADGAWKVLDFGVASLGEGSGTLTQGEAVGTPFYMAPEQAQGLRVDPRADLYALAAIAYRCLTGRYPFSGADTPAILYAVVHRVPVRPGELVELPADVDRWFAMGLAKRPDDRFADAASLAERLADALAGALPPGDRKRADALIRKQPWEVA